MGLAAFKKHAILAFITLVMLERVSSIGEYPIRKPVFQMIYSL